MFNIIDKIKLKLVGGWGYIYNLYEENNQLKHEVNALEWRIYGLSDTHIKYLKATNKEYLKELLNYKYPTEQYYKSIRNIIYYANFRLISTYIYREVYWEYYERREAHMEDKIKELENKLEDYSQAEHKMKEYSKLEPQVTELKRKLRKLKNKKDDKQFKMVTRSSKEYLWFRDAVLKRDKVCQCCGGHHDLEVHHILSFKSYNHLGADTNNGIVLCERCHKKYHSIYGKNGKSNNAATLAVFLRDYGKTLQSKLIDPVEYFDNDKMVMSYGK